MKEIGEAFTICVVAAGHAISRIKERMKQEKQFKNKVAPHTFRRSCTTELIRAGANKYHVKELLGHTTLDTLKN